ncbi:MAG: RecQ family ATP-dependent DNA helicase [Lachnospiraceae bacterium]|nr:RecQ family ATP-dependent DNA helicase [Lachnospiraceae bacterium]
MDKYEVLNRYFGYHSFREGQEQIVDTILLGKDALGIMPTGAGKSLCFQVPSMVMEGITLVISPLVSLMKDQVTSLVAAGVPAAFFNSSLTERQYLKALEFATVGKYKIIYVAPERLLTARFQSFVQKVNITMVAVDEAHCVSQWGQDFRPSYLDIPQFVDTLRKRPIITAFTATATARVKDDIVKMLRLNAPLQVVTGFDRKNLYYEVRKKQSKKNELMDIVREHRNESGIIYCTTRKKVEEVCNLLNQEGFKATRYHAGLEIQERKENQEKFIYDKANIMVATNAFGMGIDKSDVRFVVHYNMPKDIESYYQEAGRAGRDGESAQCILLYSSNDVATNKFLIENSRQNNVMGVEEEKARQKMMAEDFRRLEQMNFYCQTTECLRTYVLRYFGENVNEGCGNCSNCYEKITKEERKKRMIASLDGDLLAELKRIRKKIATVQGVPAFVVFSDATLYDMCRKMPKNDEEFLEVSGVGYKKLQQYGSEFLKVINETRP